MREVCRLCNMAMPEGDDPKNDNFCSCPRCKICSRRFRQAEFEAHYDNCVQAAVKDEVGREANLTGQRFINATNIPKSQADLEEEVELIMIGTFLCQVDLSHVCCLCGFRILQGRVAKKLKCKHYYHAICLRPYLFDKKTCPYCQRYVVN